MAVPTVTAASDEAQVRRLEEMQGRLDEQAEEIERLRSLVATPTSSAEAVEPQAPKVGRRGMLSKVLGATAAAAALTVAKEAATADAAARGTIIGGSASTTNYGVLAVSGAGDPAGLIANVTGASTDHGLIGASANPGVAPPTSSGVLGQGSSNYGVIGLSQFGIGVWGQSTNQIGVRGKSNSQAGVYGESTSGVGTTGISVNAAGAFGFSSNGVGVYGNSVNSAGVYGQAGTNAGVLGDSPVYGVWGRTSTGLGVRGEATGTGIAVYGTAAPGGFAGYFNGPVFIKGVGVLGTSGPQAASAQQSIQTVEAFGTGTLSGGQATVTLSREVSEAAGGADYAVVVTEEEDMGGLFVTAKGPTSFQVRARTAGASGPFSYRVAAKARPAARRAGGAEAGPSAAASREVPVPTAPTLPKADEPTGRDPR